MHKLKRSAAVAITLLFIATPCLAADNAMKTLFQDCFYGALTGGLVGAAVLAFTKQPGKHLDYIGYGAAGGALVGAVYGAVVTTRSLAEIENGKVKFAVPTIRPELREANSKGQTSIIATAELLRGTF
jgi:ABC-type Co2+ transport system permease subunit